METRRACGTAQCHEWKGIFTKIQYNGQVLCRQTDRQTDRQTHAQYHEYKGTFIKFNTMARYYVDRQTDRQTETVGDRDRGRQRQTQTERRKETETQRQRRRDRQRQPGTM